MSRMQKPYMLVCKASGKEIGTNGQFTIYQYKNMFLIIVDNSIYPL